MRRNLLAVITLCLCAVCLSATVEQDDARAAGPLIWRPLPQLPPTPGLERQIGLAGPFVGEYQGVLIVAGGANFPEAPPWEGGQKVWWDNIFVLQKVADGGYQWHTSEEFTLPRPLAYGVAVSTADGLVCIGGSDARQCYRDVFLLRWNPAAQEIETDVLPPLPRPLAFMAGAKVGDHIYLAGGQETIKDARATKNFWSLDLLKRGSGADLQWQELPPWPGPARVLAVAAGQSDGTTDCFYLLSGRTIAPGVRTDILTDGYCYNPQSGQWQTLSGIATPGEPARAIMAGIAIPSGVNHILAAGDDGKIFSQLEQLDEQIIAAPDRELAVALEREKYRLLENHPGFGRDILAYHTITDTWTKVGVFPFNVPVTTSWVKWDNGFVIPSGEIRPGVRTPEIWRADRSPSGAFGLLNYTILGAYLGTLVAMGVYFSRRVKTTDDFFKAGRRVPWWAAGLSLFGTSLSAITFMAIPAKTFATDWRYFMGNIAPIFAVPLVIALYIPFYRRLNVTTAYEYLERRFNLTARLLGSLMFIIFQLGRIGIVLFLPSIALSMVTGLDIVTCILVMGVLSIAYTVLGGIEAVIWTDVLQVIVLMGGAILSLLIIILNTTGGLFGMIDTALTDHKLHTFDFTFDFASPTLWVVLLGGIAASLISNGSDQVAVQRYLTTNDERGAGRSAWTHAIMCIPASLLFFGLGTALWVFFKSQPQLLNATMANADAIFPWYIVTQLPNGLAGLLIAGIFAAAMSSLDSSMNSAATAFTTDFYRRFHPKADDAVSLKVARWLTVIVGASGMLFALMMARWDIKSLWDQFNTILGLFAGGLGGMFLLGILCRRAHGVGAVFGLVASGMIQFFVSQYTAVHLLLFTFTGMASCIIMGYLASVLIPVKEKSIAGLTIYSLAKEGDS